MHKINEPDDVSPWGTYALHGMDKLFFIVPTMLGLSRGRIRKKLREKWLSRPRPAPLDVEISGIKYRLYPNDNRAEWNLLCNSKRYNDEELTVLGQAIKKDSVFFDIGANIGYYSLFAAQRQAYSYAFEPIPQIRRRQAFNIKNNGYEKLITPVPYALADAEGTSVIYITPDKLHSNTLIRKTAHQEEESYAVEVEVKKLSDMVNAYQVERIDALKIDAEGMEDRVLMPFFEESPSSVWPRLIIIEHLFPDHWKTDVIQWMKNNGYYEIKKMEGNTALAKS